MSFAIYYFEGAVRVASGDAAVSALTQRLEGALLSGEASGIAVKTANGATPVVEAWNDVAFVGDVTAAWLAMDVNSVTRETLSSIMGALAGIYALPSGPVYALASDMIAAEAFKKSYDKITDVSQDLLPWGRIFDFLDIVLDSKSDRVGVSAIMQGVNRSFRDAKAMSAVVDPLMLDLDGDGLELKTASSAILFDHNADSIRTSTGWIASDDGILVRDLDHDGSISSGRELFGIDTLKSNGQYASNGFDALRDLDSNLDGNFTNADTAWSSVQLWRDLDQDGISDAGELFGLEAVGISRIGAVGSTTNSTGGTQAGTVVGNNLIAQSASFTRSSSGVSSEFTVGAIDLEANNFHREYLTDVEITDQVKLLPRMTGSGQARDLAEAISLNTDLATRVTAFSAATTRDAQISMIDDLIKSWAQSSSYWSTLESLLGGTIAIKGLPSGMTSEGYGNMLSVLEVFNGERFFAEPGSRVALSQGLRQTGYGNAIYEIAPTSGTVERVAQSYAALSESVYGALVLQTRLKPYLDSIELVIDAAGVTFDTAALANKLAQAHSSDARAAILDLVDLDRYAGDTLQASGFDGFAVLGGWIEELPSDSPVRADLVYQGGVMAADAMIGTTVDDLYFGDNGNNIFLAGAGNYRIHGGAGNDILNGDTGNDTVFGGSGDDTLNGGEGTNRLVGGKGNDTVQLGKGVDTVLFNRGDGKDTIWQADSGDADMPATTSENLERHLVKLGSGIAAADVRVARFAKGRSSSDITLFFGEGDELTFSTTSGNPLRGFEGVEFSDGTRWSAASLIAMVAGLQTGTAGDDRLLGLFDTANSLSGGAGNDQIYGDDLHDELFGGDGRDMLSGGFGDDLLDGGAGDDLMDGGVGSDTFLFGRGSGHDTISSFERAHDEVDTVRFHPGILQSDVVLARNGLDLTLSFPGGADSLTITNYFLSGSGYNAKIEKFLFSDGASWDMDEVEERVAAPLPPVGLVLTGTSSMNFLMGQDGDDSLDGMGGNDYLLGGSGNDTYKFGRGYGTDTIMEMGAGASTADKVTFNEGVTADQLWFQKVGFDLQVGVIGTSDRLDISMWYLGAAYTVEKFQTSDGKTLLDTQVQNLVQAMAGFAPPSAGETTLPVNYQSSLNTVIAANWN